MIVSANFWLILVDQFGPDPWPTLSALITQVLVALFHGANALFAARVISKRLDFSRNPVVLTFIGLNVFCCLYRFWGVASIWSKDEILSPSIQMLTSVISMIAIAMIWLLAPVLVKLPSFDKLDELNHELTEKLEELKEQRAEKEQAQEKLLQSQKMEAVGQLTGGIAHDFNNILTAISGSLELIKRKPDNPKVERWITAAIEAVARAAHLTAQLLTFSRVQKLQIVDVEIKPLLFNLQSMMTPLLGPGIKIMFQTTHDVIVRTDKMQLELAIINLAINARDAMDGEGVLTLSTIISDQFLEICITDTGCGIPDGIVSKIFDPFFTTKEVGKGTGLGLSMVYGVAHQSGGEVYVKQTSSQGTTISLKLPLMASVIKRDVVSFACDTITKSQNKIILLIDDDDKVRDTLCEMLELIGHTVHACEDGVEALAYLKTQQPDVILLDFAMPVMNGAAVAKAIRQIHTGLPIIFITGYSTSDELRNEVVLKKPFKINDIQKLLTDTFNQSSGSST